MSSNTTLSASPALPSALPLVTNGPLAGLVVIELAGIGPSPFAGQILGDLGAKVVRIDKPGAVSLPVENRRKENLTLELKTEADKQTLRDLIKTADILTEGYRPGVCEKLGFSPQECHALNPALIFARMTGWGQTGPWAQMAGHDINYIGITGVLHAMGDADHPPSPPINFLGDYGGGSMFLITGILSALHQRHQTGTGCVIDAAIIDGTLSFSGILHSLTKFGQWSETRHDNLLDGSRPFYRCYRTSDGLFMAVGCIEPQFYQVMLDKLGLNIKEFGHQNSPAQWPAQCTQLSEIFAQNTRDEWAEIFAVSDACVTPVLTYLEAEHHPQIMARRGQNTPFPPPALKFSSP